MLSIREQHPPSRSLPSGTPSIHEKQKVRNNHGCSDKKANVRVEAEEMRSNHTEEQGRDPKLKRNRNVIGERREALMTGFEAFSVPAKKPRAVEPPDAMASPNDHVQSKRARKTHSPRKTSMSCILEHSKPTVVLEQDLNEMPAADSDVISRGDLDLPSVLQLQGAAAGLNPASDFVIPVDMEWRPVELNRAADDGDEEDENDGLDMDWVNPEGENVQETSRESSDGSLEGRYITKLRIEELPSVNSGRGQRGAVREKEMSEIMSGCLLVDKEMTDAERKKYIFGSANASKSHPQAEQGPRRTSRTRDAVRITAEIPKSKVQVEVASPPVGASTLKRRHFLQSSSTPNKELVHQDHPSRKPEGSLLHSVYLQVLACGRGGISMEELLTSFHCQSLTEGLADDWEDEVIDYLNHSPYFCFDQKQGHYRLRQSLKRPSSKRFAKGKEKESLGSTMGLDHQGCGGETSMQATRKDTKREARKLTKSKRWFKVKEKELSDSATDSNQGCGGKRKSLFCFIFFWWILQILSFRVQ